MIEIGRRQEVNVRDLGGLNKQVMSTFTGCATPTEETMSKKIIAAVDAYEFDFGTVKAVPNRFQWSFASCRRFELNALHRDCLGHHATASEPAQRARQHPLQHVVVANEVVIEPCADVRQNESNHEPTHPAMDCEELRRERFVLAAIGGKSNNPKKGVGAP